MADIPIPILSSVIGALAAIAILLLKELVDRSKSAQAAAISIAWLARSIKQSLTKDASSLSHLDLGILKSSAIDISRSKDLRKASYLLQDVYCLWRANAYLRKEAENPIVVEAFMKLDQALSLAGSDKNEA